MVIYDGRMIANIRMNVFTALNRYEITNDVLELCLSDTRETYECSDVEYTISYCEGWADEAPEERECVIDGPVNANKDDLIGQIVDLGWL